MQSHDEFYLMQEHYFRPKLNNVHLVVYVVNKTSKLKQNVTSDRRRFFTFEWSEVGQTEHVYCLTNLLKKLLYEAMYLLFPSYIYHFIAAYLYNIDICKTDVKIATAKQNELFELIPRSEYDFHFKRGIRILTRLLWIDFPIGKHWLVTIGILIPKNKYQ